VIDWIEYHSDALMVLIFAPAFLLMTIWIALNIADWFRGRRDGGKEPQS